MIKKRIIAGVIVKNGIVVQSIKFKKYLPIGKPEITLENLSRWGADEIILLNIDKIGDQNFGKFEFLKDATKNCFVPLTVGGGISSINKAEELFKLGADKISFNSACLTNPKLIENVASKFGNQSLICSIDFVKQNGNFYVYDHLNKVIKLELCPVKLALELQERGAGEILLNSIDRDGTYSGLEIEILKKFDNRLKIPIIIMGGASCSTDFKKTFETNSINAVCASNIFQFTEHSISKVKSILSKDFDIRVNKNLNYESSIFDKKDRLLKKEDLFLNDLLFKKVISEEI